MTNKEAAMMLAKELKKNKELREAHNRMDEQWKQYRRLKRKSSKGC